MVGVVEKQQAVANNLAGLDRAFVAAIEAASSINTLQELVQTVVVSILRRTDDAALRDRTLATIAAYFGRMRCVEGMAPRDKLSHLRLFARETINIVLAERPLGVAGARPAAPSRRASDAAAAAKPAAVAVAPRVAPTPVALAAAAPVPGGEGIDLMDTRLSVSDVEKPTFIHQPEPPRPQRFGSFRELLPAALRYRLCSLTRFFQRSNGEVNRELVRPFLLAPEFEARFMTVVDTIIVPKMFTMSRNLLTLETSRKWDEVSTAGFWAYLADNDKVRIGLVGAWEEAWNSCKQRETLRKVGGETKKVLVAQPELKKIRELLTPEHAGVYDIPPVRNREIELFVSLLTDFDLYRLEYCFTKLRQMYEQELDRRWYQDRARSGSLRDSLLEAIEAFPDRTGDFLALLCYYCFPNTDLFFLERFTHNKGSNHAARVERLPYLMRFLAGERIDAVRDQERRDRRERDAAIEEERKRMAEAEREASARLYA